MPLLWTAVSYVAFSVMNPDIRDGVAWFWFVISQLVFGIVAAVVFMCSKNAARSSPASSAARRADCSCRSPRYSGASRLVTGSGTRSTCSPRWRRTRRPADSGRVGIVSRRLVRGGPRRSRDPVTQLRFGVRDRAAASTGDTRTARLGRPVDAAALDRFELRHDGRCESGAARASRLAMVCGVAVCVRHRGGDRRSCDRKKCISPRRATGPDERAEFVAN